MAQRLEELGTRAEVGLLQPAGGKRNKSGGSRGLGMLSGKREDGTFAGGWQMEQPTSTNLFHLHTQLLPAGASGRARNPDIASSDIPLE